MPNNIIITGDKYTGKSTIVRNLLDNLDIKPGGFIVKRTGEIERWLSFYLIDAIYYNSGKESLNQFKTKSHVFAKRDHPTQDWQLHPEVFDNKGVELLTTGFMYRKLVVMDELGRFELKAYHFKNRVLQILNSRKPVLAVLKNEHNEFLDKIRKRNDHDIYRVKKDNQKNLYENVFQKLKGLIKANEKE